MNKLKILFLSALICLCAMSCQKNDKNQNPQNQTAEVVKLEKSWAGKSTTLKIFYNNKEMSVADLSEKFPQYASQLSLISSLKFSELNFTTAGKYSMTVKVEGKQERTVEGKWDYVEMSDNKKINVYMNLDEVYGAQIDVVNEPNVTFVFDINNLTASTISLSGSAEVLVLYAPYIINVAFEGIAK